MRIRLCTHGVTTVGGVTAGQPRHNSRSNVGGVTAGQPRHYSRSNVGGVTAGQVRHNSSTVHYLCGMDS